MVLSWFGVSFLRQSSLFDEIHEFITIDEDVGWLSSPEGLENALNKHKPADYTGEFQIYAREDQIGIARRMVWTLFQFKVPCAALVKGGSHWIVVYSYEPLDIKPLDSSDTSYDITGFFIRDPVHKSEQGHVDYVTWQVDYAIPVQKGSHWDGKFLCICDPTPEKRKGGKVKFPERDPSNPQNPDRKKFVVKTNAAASDKEKPPLNKTTFNSAKGDFPDSQITMMPNPVKRDKKIIDENTARNYAHWVLQTRGIHKSKALKMNMKKPSPGDPALVEYIGKDDFYYIVPMKDFNKKIYATMIIAAMKANYRESSFAMDFKKPLVFTPLTEKKILNLLIKKKYIKSQESEGIKFHKALVWKSCNQSLTPFLPFHMVTIKGKKVFVRIDGKVFKKLTQGSPGF
jgi:hypothetical protein